MAERLTIETGVDNTKANAGLKELKSVVKDVAKDIVSESKAAESSLDSVQEKVKKTAREIERMRKAHTQELFSTNKSSGMYSGIGAHEKENPVVGAFQEGIKGVAAGFAIEKILEFGKAVQETAHEIQEGAERTNVSVEKYQMLTRAFSMLGSDAEGAEKALNKVAVSAAKAAAGNSELVEAFSTLGISFSEMQTMSPDQLLLRISDTSSKAENKQLALAAAVQVLGKEAGKLKPVLAAGAAEIERLGNSGVKMGEQAVTALDKAWKSAKNFGTNVMNIAGNVAGAVIRTGKTTETGIGASILFLKDIFTEGLGGAVDIFHERMGNANGDLDASKDKASELNVELEEAVKEATQFHEELAKAYDEYDKLVAEDKVENAPIAERVGMLEDEKKALENKAVALKNIAYLAGAGKKSNEATLSEIKVDGQILEINKKIRETKKEMATEQKTAATEALHSAKELYDIQKSANDLLEDNIKSTLDAKTQTYFIQEQIENKVQEAAKYGENSLERAKAIAEIQKLNAKYLDAENNSQKETAKEEEKKIDKKIEILEHEKESLDNGDKKTQQEQERTKELEHQIKALDEQKKKLGEIDELKIRKEELQVSLENGPRNAAEASVLEQVNNGIKNAPTRPLKQQKGNGTSTSGATSSPDASQSGASNSVAAGAPSNPFQGLADVATKQLEQQTQMVDRLASIEALLANTRNGAGGVKTRTLMT